VIFALLLHNAVGVNQQKKCLPGGLKTAACPTACSSSGWNFDANTCKRTVKSGYLRMSHDATKIVKATITEPKAKVSTTLKT